MAPLPPPRNPTIDAIYRAYEASAEDGLRPHLGASLIGHDCERSLYYTFHWATVERHDGRLLRLFQTGHLAESRFVADLRRIGCEVQETDPETGNQWRVSAVGGHFAGSMDGVVLGLPEAPRTWHVAEFKTHGEKSFTELKKKGVKEAKPLHWSQMQVYMHLGGLDRAFYMAVNKNTDELYAERVRIDADEGTRLVAKAERVIRATAAPPRIAATEDFYKCRFCSHGAVCWGKAAPPRHCRSCVFSEAVEGGWKCGKSGNGLSVAEQKAGCPDHRYSPTWIPGEQVDAAEDGSWISYEMSDESGTWTDKGDVDVIAA
jgi:hypothetical protein